MQRLSDSIADWENLLPELLAAIAKRLTSTLDYTSFRGVCNSWRSAATFDNFDHAFPQVPWLMLIARNLNLNLEEEEEEVYVTKFLDLSRNKKMFRIADLPKEDAKLIKYYFSCSGWLLGVVEKSSAHPQLMHPIRRNIRIKLPDLDTFPRVRNPYYIPYWPFMIGKMVLSGSPTIISDLVIMVIWSYKRQLAFSRPGDSAWTLMEQWDGSFTDILYYNGKLYAIDYELRVVECDIHGPNPTRMQQIMSIDHVDNSKQCRCYMVESLGKFLIVLVYKHRFRVFEFDLTDGTNKEIDDLGNKTLFLSPNSTSLCLEGFAWNDEVEPNCVYEGDSGLCWYMGKRCFKRFLSQDFVRRVYFPAWVDPGF